MNRRAKILVDKNLQQTSKARWIRVEKAPKLPSLQLLFPAGLVVGEVSVCFRADSRTSFHADVLPIACKQLQVTNILMGKKNHYINQMKVPELLTNKEHPQSWILALQREWADIAVSP